MRRRWGMFRLISLGCMASAALPSARAQEQTPASPPVPAKSAPELVREANDLLLDDKPADALKAYEEAARLRPDAREIAFDQALARYKLGEFDQARESFNRVAAGASDALADDALYGLGAIDHAQALAATDPKQAIAHVEGAMRNYQTVLGNHPDHAAAREANLKAASYWRQLKQQMQQQEQQQQQQPQDQQNEENKEQQEQQQQQSQQNREQQQEQQEEQQQQQEQQQQEQQQQANQENQQEQKDKEQKEQQARAEKENDSQEQAERKLREMVQAMRDRKKHRKQDAKPPTFRPAEKDW